MSKTFVDQIPPETGRKYSIAANPDGTSRITDVTAYEQEGTAWGAADANQAMRKEDYDPDGTLATDGIASATALSSKAAKTQELTATLTAANWTGASAPFTQSISMPGVVGPGPNESKGKLSLARGTTAAQRAAASKAKMDVLEQGTDTVTVVADGTRPTIDLPVVLHIWG